MNSMLMSELHQSPAMARSAAQPWAWRLARHEVTTMKVATEPRWLRVKAGSVWITQVSAVTPAQAPDDIWLAAGQSMCLPAHTVWLLEAWQAAELSVVVPAPSPAPPCEPTLKRGWWSLFWARLSLAQQPS